MRGERADALPVANWRDGINLARALSGVLVVILVLASLWGSRGLHEPVAGFGIVDESGVLLPPGNGEIEVGQALPEFRLLSTEDDLVDLDSLEGQPAVIHLWNTWCLDCIADLPVIQQVADQWDGRVTVVGIAPDEPGDRVAKAASRYDASYTMLLDSNEAVVSRYGATTRPVTIVVDAEGVIVALHEGPVAFEDIERSLAPLLSGSG